MPPLITLTTDFGTRDAFVGVMKGIILGIAPQATIVDLTHEVPPQDVRAAAYLLRGAAPYFPPGTIHVAVVDPGVGSARRALVVATRSGFYVAPDNGLVSLVAPRRDVRGIWDVSRSRYRRPHPSRTFHGRDVFAPIAAQLARGTAPDALGRRVRAMARLAPPRLRRGPTRTVGEVVWIDRFGNAITNVTSADLPSRRADARRTFRARSLSVTIGDAVLPFRDTYSDVARGEPLALLNSADLVEIAVNQGSAAAQLALAPGTAVVIERG